MVHRFLCDIVRYYYIFWIVFGIKSMFFLLNTFHLYNKTTSSLNLKYCLDNFKYFIQNIQLTVKKFLIVLILFLHGKHTKTTLMKGHAKGEHNPKMSLKNIVAVFINVSGYIERNSSVFGSYSFKNVIITCKIFY